MSRFFAVLVGGFMIIGAAACANDMKTDETMMKDDGMKKDSMMKKETMK